MNHPLKIYDFTKILSYFCFSFVTSDKDLKKIKNAIKKNNKRKHIQMKSDADKKFLAIIVH